MIKTKKQSLIIVGVFIIALMLFTTTYAFFNYTRTGTANTIKTGRIAFNSSQGTAINLTNMFPIDVSEGIPNDNTKVGTVTINVTGDTTYTEGLEYKVSAVNVSNTVGSKTLPISIDVNVANNTNNDPATTLGTAITGEGNYYTSRGSTTSVYKVVTEDTISSNSELLMGYIAPGQTGVDGNIVIRAYLDASKIAISDTYPEGDVTHTEGEESNQEEVVDYTNGTTSTWGGDRTVFTTTEWNSLQTNGVSFQVKVESNEGIWIEEPIIPTIETCPNCKFMYLNNNAYQFGSNNANATLVSSIPDGIVKEDYNDVIAYSGKNYFLGFTETQSGKIDRGFVCGIKAEDPNIGVAFCIEGMLNDSTGGTSAQRNAIFTSNRDFLYQLYGPEIEINSNGCWETNSGTIYCTGAIKSYMNSTDYAVQIYYNGKASEICFTTQTGYLGCHT